MYILYISGSQTGGIPLGENVIFLGEYESHL